MSNVPDAMADSERPEAGERERLAKWCEIQATHADDHAAVARSKAKGTQHPGYHAEMANDYDDEARDFRTIAAILRAPSALASEEQIDEAFALGIEQAWEQIEDAALGWRWRM